MNIWTAFISLCGRLVRSEWDWGRFLLPLLFYTLCVSPQVQSTSWMPHQQYVMQPTVSTLPFTCSSFLWVNPELKVCGLPPVSHFAVFSQSCWKEVVYFMFILEIVYNVYIYLGQYKRSGKCIVCKNAQGTFFFCCRSNVKPTKLHTYTYHYSTTWKLLIAKWLHHFCPAVTIHSSIKAHYPILITTRFHLS